jgi:SAM-dependent methyltransferase
VLRLLDTGWVRVRGPGVGDTAPGICSPRLVDSVNTGDVQIDPRVRRRYELVDEGERLRQPGLGDLVRLRTWDIFDRFLPESGRIADIGGGPGTHSAYLARRGYEVVLIDPVPRHVEAAAALSASQPQAPFQVEEAEARHLSLADGDVDAALVMGPLYHLVERDDRVAALTEAARVVRPGGRILAEVITRYAWVMDATLRGLLTAADTWDDFDWMLRTGQSKDPAKLTDGSFWAYFHRPEELVTELELAGFRDVQLLAVEGFAWLMGDLPERMTDPADLLRAIRLTESEPSLLGVSSHVIGCARRDGDGER